MSLQEWAKSYAWQMAPGWYTFPDGHTVLLSSVVGYKATGDSSLELVFAGGGVLEVVHAEIDMQDFMHWLQIAHQRAERSGV